MCSSFELIDLTVELCSESNNASGPKTVISEHLILFYPVSFPGVMLACGVVVLGPPRNGGGSTDSNEKVFWDGPLRGRWGPNHVLAVVGRTCSYDLLNSVL